MLKIGHRGNGASYGENTMLSFKLAFLAGANGIEYDVRATKDGQLVVVHDETVNRTTNGAGAVSDYTYEELRQLNAGFIERIPLFEEVLFKFHDKAFQNVEIKDKRIAEKILHTIECYGPPDAKNILVSAFDWDELKPITLANIPTALLADKEKIDELGEYGFITEASRRGASAINPEFTAVTPSLIFLARKAGLKVYSWTVDEPNDIARMKEFGVDGIISNYPKRL